MSNKTTSGTLVPKKILAVITARGGSKRIPRKNLRKLAGRPLIYYPIQAALRSKLVDRVIVSTDDVEIAEVAKKIGAEIPFIRPDRLATDLAKSVPVVQHAVRFLKKNHDYHPAIVALLQPTNPFLSGEDIDEAIKILIKSKADSCVSVSPVSERPEWMYTIKRGRLAPHNDSWNVVKRSQDLPKVFRLNGALYVVKTEALMNQNTLNAPRGAALIMPRERSIDIDNLIDFKIAEALMKKY